MTDQARTREDIAQALPRLSDGEKLLLQVHLEEYRALMARNTSALQWQWALIPAAVIFLGLVANSWDRLDHRLLAWSSVAAVQAAMILASHLGWDLYGVIDYIETDLRRCVQGLLYRAMQPPQEVRFWGYEVYRTRQRGTRPLWWEWTSVGCAPILVCVIAATRRPFSAWDWCGLIVNVLLLTFLVYKTWSMVSLRARWSGSLRQQLGEGTAKNEA
jgi:hypothetical protein